MPQPTVRPIFLDLLRIRFPASAWASLGHRASGVLLVLALPASLYVLQTSLADAAGYAQARELLGAGWMLPVWIVLLWALLHHSLAGGRFLLLDLGVGHGWQAARRSAWIVNLLAPALTLVFAIGLLLL